MEGLNVKVEPGSCHDNKEVEVQSESKHAEKRPHPDARERLYFRCGQCEYKGMRQENFRRHYKRCHPAHIEECEAIVKKTTKTPDNASLGIVSVAGSSCADSGPKVEPQKEIAAKKRRNMWKLVSEESSTKYYNKKGEVVKQVKVSRSFSPHVLVDMDLEDDIFNFRRPSDAKALDSHIDDIFGGDLKLD